MKAGILTIGDEILIGQTVNTNAAFIGEKLQLVGGDIIKTVVVGDTIAAIQQELSSMAALLDLLIVTGGLGPTHDDVTKKAIAQFLGKSLIINNEALDRCKKLFEQRNSPMPIANATQGEVIEGSEVLQNDYGTAPGMILHNAVGTCTIVILPGVPREMQMLFIEQVLPRLKKLSTTHIMHSNLCTAGIGESRLAEVIGNPELFLSSSTSLAFLPSTSTGVKIRISTKSNDEEFAIQENKRIKEIIVSKISPFIYSEGTDIEEVIVGTLTERKLTLAIAESCTGGLVSNRITNVPGASSCFMCGIVAYSNQAKILLGVQHSTLITYGAVSKEVASELAQCVMGYAQTDIGLSITGIAGPGGASEHKPVGLAWLGFATGGKLQANLKTIKLVFGNDRVTNKELFSFTALNLIREETDTF